MNTISRRNLFNILLTFGYFCSLGLGTLSAAPNESGNKCYLVFADLSMAAFEDTPEPLVLHANRTEVPIRDALEKEGLYYNEIAIWFDTVDKVAKQKMRQRLSQELRKEKPQTLTRWLKDFNKHYYRKEAGAPLLGGPAGWMQLSPRDKLNWILDRENPFEVINVKGREALFTDDILTFNELRRSSITPDNLTVGDDLGSYEVRSLTGVDDIREYRRQRAIVEDHLEERVGHQHNLHAWPTDPTYRKEIAPRYIETLDATTWYQFWRSAKNAPVEDERFHIFEHEFLGVYDRDALDRLHKAMVDGKPEDFHNKYRMTGARVFKALKGQEAGGSQYLPDWELRSGKRKRDFIENVTKARLATGDYDGLLEYNSYSFDSSTPLRDLVQNLVSAEETELLLRFESDFPKLKFSPNKLALNHYRNKIIAPLLPWGNRLNLSYKADLLKKEQKRFATKLAKIAQSYYDSMSKEGLTPRERRDITNHTSHLIGEIHAYFSRTLQLDYDFGRYISPRPSDIPGITVTPTGAIDVNQFPIGIEFSFRFGLKPHGKTLAEKEIRLAAEAFAEKLGGGSVVRMPDAGHGHGLSIRYQVTDLEGKVWRVEWDGITRSYKEDGRPVLARSGHMEVPTPKFAPQDISDVQTLYETMRELGHQPARWGGGGHFNFSLEPLFALPELEGARKMANIIALFETNRDLISFLFQHPNRYRVAMPIEITKSFAKRLNEFNGTWFELSQLLYEGHYFNPFIGRKPAYTQLNLTGLVTDAAPEAYKQSIDIKKATEETWFPSFAGKSRERAELRMTDAPTDEYMAALMIKYMRALLDQALNTPGTIPLEQGYNAPFSTIQRAYHGVTESDVTPHLSPWIERWREDPKLFTTQIKEHLIGLNLDPKEFVPLIAESIQQQIGRDRIPEKGAPYLKFKPAAEEEMEEDSETLPTATDESPENSVDEPKEETLRPYLRKKAEQKEKRLIQGKKANSQRKP